MKVTSWPVLILSVYFSGRLKSSFRPSICCSVVRVVCGGYVGTWTDHFQTQFSGKWRPYFGSLDIGADDVDVGPEVVGLQSDQVVFRWLTR